VMPHLIQPGTGEHSAYCSAAGLGDQTDNQPDECRECRGGEARAERGQEPGQRARRGGAGWHRRITLTRTVNERPMLASSRSKIHEPRVTGVSPRPTDQRQRQKLRNTRGPGRCVASARTWWTSPAVVGRSRSAALHRHHAPGVVQVGPAQSAHLVAAAAGHDGQPQEHSQRGSLQASLRTATTSSAVSGSGSGARMTGSAIATTLTPTYLHPTARSTAAGSCCDVELEEPNRGGASDHQAVGRIAALRHGSITPQLSIGGPCLGRAHAIRRSCR
jgi:hypothetical protein